MGNGIYRLKKILKHFYFQPTVRTIFSISSCHKKK